MKQGAAAAHINTHLSYTIIYNVHIVVLQFVKVEMNHTQFINKQLSINNLLHVINVTLALLGARLTLISSMVVECVHAYLQVHLFTQCVIHIHAHAHELC